MKAFFLVLFLALVCPLQSADAPAKPNSIRGRVVSVLEHGVLLNCQSRDYLSNNDQTDGFDLEDVGNVIFLAGHPKQKDLVDGQRVGVIGVRVGTYRYTNTLGAEAKVAAFKFVKLASNL